MPRTLKRKNVQDPTTHRLRVQSFTGLLLIVCLTTIVPFVANAQDESNVETAAESQSAGSTGLEFMAAGTVPSTLEQLRLMEEHVAELAEQCKPATVNVQVGMAQGTGVVVSRSGYILTAAHVITRPGLDAVITFPDGKRYRATTLGTHPGIDSGMLKLNEKKRWPHLEVGESGTLNLGQWVMAIGHPGGLNKDRGLVVRVGRILTKSNDVLRTDCALVGGDSGGPLIDMDGNVIGIHSRIGSTLRDNLHVPIDIFSDEWDMLADEFGVVVGSERPYLGLDILGTTNKVDMVERNQPAAKAGIKRGDKIIKFNGKKVSNRKELGLALKDLNPRDSIKLTVERIEKPKKTAASSPPEEAKKDESDESNDSDESNSEAKDESTDANQDEANDDSDDAKNSDSKNESPVDGDTKKTEAKEKQEEGNKVELELEITLGYR